MKINFHKKGGNQTLASELTGWTLSPYTMKDLQSGLLKTRIYFRFLKFQSSCRKFASYLEQNCKSKY